MKKHLPHLEVVLPLKKIIYGRVENQITFISPEFTATNDSQEFWDKLREYAHSINRYVVLMEK